MLNRFLPALTLLALAAFAWSGSDYYTGLAVKLMIYAIFALSLQLLVGGAGLVSLGHAAFFGIGAVVAALADAGAHTLLIGLSRTAVLDGGRGFVAALAGTAAHEPDADAVRRAAERLADQRRQPGRRRTGGHPARLGDDDRVIRESSSGQVRSLFAVHQLSDVIAEICSRETISGVARQILDDRLAAAENAVHQSRFADIRPPDDGECEGHYLYA